MRARFTIFYLGAVFLLIIGAFVTGALLYNLPPIHDRLAWRIDNLRARIHYALNPPAEAIFIPQETIEPLVQGTLRALQSTATFTPTSTPTLEGPTPTPLPTSTSTVIPTPLPVEVRLTGVKYEDQHNRWNYCGPANLSMAMTFWGWQGNRDVVGKAIKPNDKDKNVMPYEMEQFVEAQAPDLAAVVRSGGEIDLVKRMVAAGFPVLAEKGYYEYDYNGKLGWMGHYQFITGYDDQKKVLVVQDTYNDGPNFEITYEKFLEGWRSFDYVFLIVYPRQKEAEVLTQLGPWSDAGWANRHALEIAQTEVQNLQGIDQFFAAFNIGTSHVGVQEYFDAATAYDYAFQLYAALPDDSQRPFRMMWYQTGPYFAYYYTGRYQDVVNLADTTLQDTISEPVLEESLYWRAMAEVAIGESDAAIQDLQASLKVHPGFAPSLDQLQQMGVTP